MDLVPCPSCGAFSTSETVCSQCRQPILAEAEPTGVPVIALAPLPADEAPPSGPDEPIGSDAAPAAEEAPPDVPAPDAPPPLRPFEATPDIAQKIASLEAQIAQKPHAPAIYLQLAKTYLDGKRTDLAVATLERCLAVDPMNVYVRHRLAQLTGSPAAPIRPPGAATPASAPARPTTRASAGASTGRTAAPTSFHAGVAVRPTAAPTPNLMRGLDPRYKAAIAGGVLLVLLGVGAKVWLFPSTRRLVAGEFRAFAPSWSPTGKHIAFVLDDGQATRLAAYDLRNREMRPLAPTSAWESRGFSWSPDGSRIAYTAHGSGEEGDEAVYVVDVATGQSRRIAAGSSPAWSLDGQDLLMTCAPERPVIEDESSYQTADWTPRFCTVNTASGQARRSAVAAEPGVSVSPVVQKALFERYADDPAEATATAVARSDGDFESLTDAVAAGGARNVAEGSRDLSRELTARQYMEKRKAARGADRLPYAADVMVTEIGSGQPVAITSDGKSAFPSWTPDGERILFATNGSSGIEVWSMNPDGRDRRLVLGHGLKTVDPSSVTLSMDGKHVFFVAPVKGDAGLARLMTGESPADLFTAPTGGKEARRIENEHPFKQRFAVSPDGKRIAYEVLQDVKLVGGAQKSEIWLVRH